MENSEKKQDYNHLLTGLVTAAILIAYFLAMRAGGLAIYPEFRMFNFVILFAGVYYSMRREVEKEDKGFFPRLGDGLLTVFSSVSIFAVFMCVWLSYDTTLMDALKHTSTMNVYLAPETAAIAVFAEGVSSGAIMAYIFLSYTESQTSAKRKKDEIEAHE